MTTFNVPIARRRNPCNGICPRTSGTMLNQKEGLPEWQRGHASSSNVRAVLEARRSIVLHVSELKPKLVEKFL
jgi:hypothetical protein